MRIPGSDRAIGNLVKWATKDEWSPRFEEVFADHLDIVHERFGTTDEEIIDLLGAVSGSVYDFILEDFFTARFGEEGELNVIDDYLSRRGWREKVLARRYLEAIRDSAPSLYEVVDLDPGRSMTVRDMMQGGDPVIVEEKSGSETAVRWDRIAGRLVTVNKKPCFTGAILLFPHQVADGFLSTIGEMTKQLSRDLRKEARKRGEPMELAERDLREMILSGPMVCCLFTEAWLIDAISRARAPLPEIQNTDGDPIVFSEVRFPIEDDEAKIAGILDGIGEFQRYEDDEPLWGWHGPGSPPQRMSRDRQEELTFISKDQTGRTSLGNVEIAGGALVLSANSRERAETGRDLLGRHLGNLLGAPLTSHQDLEKMLEERSESTPMESDLPPEAAEEAIHFYMDDHYRRTLDDPLPMLGGKTPHQAVKSKKGRAQVVDWLKQLENSEIRRAAGQGQKPYDTAWMWRELNIEGFR